MTWALLISVIIGGTFFFLWQDEHEKRTKAEKQITDLKRQLKRGQKQEKPRKSSSGLATIEKSNAAREYVIKKPQPQVIEPRLDQIKLVELKKQTEESQDMLAEIFTQEEESARAGITASDDQQMLGILEKLFDKGIWTSNELVGIVGPNVIIGNLLEQINDYSCSKIDDIVLEEDGELIYVTTEYKEQLI